tara:strand:+ start:105 stop:239 length:135 start_codon:yes stop_codon:yes gene_type:complete
MMFWKLLWQLLFILGFIFFIVMFFKFTLSGFRELKALLRDKDEG